MVSERPHMDIHGIMLMPSNISAVEKLLHQIAKGRETPNRKSFPKNRSEMNVKSARRTEYED